MDDNKRRFNSDLEFVRERLLQDARQIELPASLCSGRLLSLLDALPDEQEEQPAVTRRTLWRSRIGLVACAACVALMFYGFYHVVEKTSASYVRSGEASSSAEAAPAASSSAPMLAAAQSTAAAAAQDAAAGLKAEPAEAEEEEGAVVILPAAEQPAAADYKAIFDAIGEIEREQKINYVDGGIRANPPTAGSGDVVVMESVITDAEAPAAAPVEPVAGMNSSSVYSTNTQIAGVDEADIVKTDGSYIYHYRFDSETGGAQIAISGASNLKPMSVIELPEYADAELYVSGDRLVVVYQTTEEITGELLEPLSETTVGELFPSGPEVIVPDYYRSENRLTMTETVVYDIASRTAPKEVKRFAQDGRYISSRLADGVLYLVSNKSFSNVGIFDARPAFGTLPVVAEDGEARLLEASSILLPPYREHCNYAVVSSLALESGESNTRAVLGMADGIMMSRNSLFLTADLYEDGYRSRSTGIVRFVISDGELKYVSSGSVEGYIDNQFSLDEYEGDLRIATTSYGEKGDTVNNLYVLDPQMEQVGAVEGLAEGERIYSVRFMGETAYVVTFRETDPLFVIDLSDPAKPTVKGELKIPGFSEYLHPVDADTLVGVGVNTVTNRYGGVLQDGLKLSLFDVSDPTDPKETASLLLGNRGSSSEALEDHRAVMWYPEKKLLGFPATLYTVRGASAENPWGGESALAFSGYLVVSVQEDGFEVVGQLSDQQTEGGFMRNEYGSAIERGLYIGETLYTAAARGIRAYQIGNYSLIGEMVYDS